MIISLKKETSLSNHVPPNNGESLLILIKAHRTDSTIMEVDIDIIIAASSLGLT